MTTTPLTTGLTRVVDKDEATYILKVNPDGSLNVTAAITPSGTQDVNLTKVAGTAVTAGAGSVTAGTQRNTLASDDPAVTALQTFSQAVEYETVAASQTAQVLGAAGATGDYLAGILIIPATTSPGQVLLLDNATSITIFVGGATSVPSLIPFFVPLGMKSVSGAWKVTTGTNVSCIGIGNFT